MKRISTAALVGMTLLMGACVTINVYFPAAAAEKAADRIIDEVWGEQPKKPSTSGQAEPVSGPALALKWMLDRLVPAAHAQQADLDVSSPAIQAITGSMEGRHGTLLPFWNSGAVGLTRDGLVAVRDPKSVGLADRRRLNELVAGENADRQALYREIARANGHPEWEREIQLTFARRWIDRASAGWWYQGASGWIRK